MNSYTEQELEISNKSYTNKDFNTIYPELLDLVKKLTNKWDPTTSNESDPGVVLLKLWAILADKNNYNIDKNILETFPLSVTQRANAQKLYDMLGYDMHYYKSAITDITLWYIGNALNIESDKCDVSELTVPKFTMITDDSGEVIFTLLNETIFSAKASPVVVKAIQGTIHDYEVNGVTDITLDNLDSEYRLFFTESRIAENGIFIANKGSGTLNFDEWNKVTNLESATLNSKVYKFGVLPNTQSCYIQFPQDIGTLIGNGLKIKYIISDGVSGNVQANQLTTFRDQIIPLELTHQSLQEDDNYSEYYEKSINNDVTIKNIYSTTNGADPEDLDSAYKNYKKTIGTFNTLVTIEDYEKAIYNLVDDLGLPFCSNVVVSDRTNNIVYSTDVVTLNRSSVEHQLHVDSTLEKITPLDEYGGELTVTDEEGKPIYAHVYKPKLSAFDLGLHILNPMVDIEDKTGYYYNKSFSVTTLYDDIVTQISDIQTNNQYYKSVEHDFINTIGNNTITYKQFPELSSTDSTNSTGAIPYIFKNFYTLNGKVITYYKVTEDEAKEIEDNIRLALFRDYNARKVSFGQKIKYEDLVKTIEQADTRIKTLILNEPEYELKYMSGNDYVGSADSAIPLPIDSDSKSIQGTNRSFTQRLLYELLLKMIVSGHVQLYNFNKDVEFDFGQTDIKQHKNISYITSKFPISLDKSSILSDDGYQVQENQNIILYAPNFYTKTSYGAYVNYYLNGKQSYDANVYYKLGSEDSIQLQYIDENGVSKSPIIKKETCIRFVDSSNSTATLTMNNVTVKKDIITDDNTTQQYDMCTLSATQSIEVMEVNQVTFPSDINQKVLHCMWFTNKQQIIRDDGETKVIEYELFGEGESEKLLQDNEYFMYTNADKNELVIVGSGTLLVRPTYKNPDGSVKYGPAIKHRSNTPVESIVANGQSAIADSDWYAYSLVPVNSEIKRGLGIVELQIVTLGAGAGVRFEGTSALITPKSELAELQNELAILEINKISLPKAIETLNNSVGEINRNIAKYEALKQVNIQDQNELSTYVITAKSQDETATDKIDALYTFSDKIADIIATQSNDYILDLQRKYLLHKESFSLIGESQIEDVTGKAEEILVSFITYVSYYNNYLDEKLNQLNTQLAQDSLSLDNLKRSFDNIDTDTSQKQFEIEAKEEEIERLKGNIEISNIPTAIINPQYCEEYNKNIWVKLDDYQLGSDNNINDINYYRGWSIMSRFNLMVGPSRSQSIGAGAKIILNPDDKGDGESIQDRKILSNTILAFGGGEKLEVTSSSGDPINIYSYTSMPLPTYTNYAAQGTPATDNYFERGTDGFISISWKDWIRSYDNENKYSYDIDDETGRTAANRLFPISFATDDDIIKIEITGKVAITLSGENTEAKIQVKDDTGSYTPTDAITINSSNNVAYIDLPDNCKGLYIQKFARKKDVRVDSTSAAIEILTDTLRIGYPQLQILSESDSKFSQQVTTTLENIGNPYNGSDFAQNTLIQDIQNRFSNFDITYNVLPEDAIDGEATISNNYNNLFAGDIIWDKKHICNRYTIPQYDFKNSSVKVAQVYIKK